MNYDKLEENLKKDVTFLGDRRKEYVGTYDKTLLTLSAASLGLSISFSGSLDSPGNTLWVLGAWICWSLSSLMILFSFWGLAATANKRCHLNRQAIELIQNREGGSNDTPIAEILKKRESLDGRLHLGTKFFCAFIYGLGLLFFIIYGYENAVQEPKPDVEIFLL